jgi:hypothetical protein
MPLDTPSLTQLNLGKALYAAVQTCSAADVRKLLERGANPNFANGLIGTIVVPNSSLQILKLLCEGGLCLKQYGTKILDAALNVRWWSTATYLFKNGVGSTKAWEGALSTAYEQRNISGIRFLITVNKVIKSPRLYCDLLHFGIQEDGSHKVITKLLSEPYISNCPTDYKEITQLLLVGAVWHGGYKAPGVVRHLIKIGVSPNLLIRFPIPSNPPTISMLKFAMQKKRLSIAFELLGSAKPIENLTGDMLTTAIKKERFDLAKRLLKHGLSLCENDHYVMRRARRLNDKLLIERLCELYIKYETTKEKV